MFFTDASLSGHIAFLEEGDLEERTQADTAATDACASSGARNTYPSRWRSRPQRIFQQFDVKFGRSDPITSVGHGPIGIDTAQPPVSVRVTRTLADACATPSRRTKPTVNTDTRRPKAGKEGLGTWRMSTQAAMSSSAKKVAVPTANDKGRDCLVWDVTKNVW